MAVYISLRVNKQGRTTRKVSVTDVRRVHTGEKRVLKKLEEI
jgi:hypothetical protein